MAQAEKACQGPKCALAWWSMKDAPWMVSRTQGVPPGTIVVMLLHSAASMNLRKRRHSQRQRECSRAAREHVRDE